MAWELIEEHVDAAEGLHRMVFENKSVKDRSGKPVRTERAFFLKRQDCPYCGHVQKTAKDAAAMEITPEDLRAARTETLGKLNEDAAAVQSYARKHGVKVK